MLSPEKASKGFCRGRDAGSPSAPRTDPYGQHYCIRLLPRILGVEALLHAHRASRSTRWSGSASGARSPARCSPWSVAFPPYPPPVAFHCCWALRRYYATVRLPIDVRVGLLAQGLLQPARHTFHDGRRWGLPVLARGVSIHAWGLRLRGVLR